MGIPLSKLELELEGNCNINIMLKTYFSLWKAFPNELKRELESNARDSNMNIPSHIALLTEDTKGTKNIRNVWYKKDINDIIIYILYKYAMPVGVT